MSGACHVAALEVRTTAASTTLVEGVDLAVGAGEIRGVVGETGAGKTLSMRSILGLLPAGLVADGRVTIAGRRIALNDGEALRGLLGTHTSAVFQNPVSMFDPIRRVGDQLVEGVRRSGLMRAREARTRAIDLLGEMGFDEPDRVLRLYPHELSGGMAQRAATAMAMMPRPSLLVLDEPTSALDASVRLDVLSLFRRVARSEGTAAFMVSHDLGSVGDFCDSLSVMYAGRVVEAGPTAAVLERPAHPYTAALLDSSSSLDAPSRTPLPAIPGAPPVPGAWPPACVFAPRCPNRTAVCTAERPALEPVERRGRTAACHHAETLVA